MNFDNFKKIMQDKKKVVMVSVAVLLLLLAVVGTTYAYFTATVIGNKDDNNVVITNGVMALEYIDGNQVALTNAVPGDKVTKTFKVKNTGNVTTTYTIYMSELINDFADKTDLVYTLTGTNGGKNVSETQVPDNSGAIASDVSIDAGVTQEYTLVITFKETNDVQDDNQGKKFSTRIQINQVVDVIAGNKLVDYVKKQYDSGTKQIFLSCPYETTREEACINFEYDLLTADDADSNIRYVGKDPDNYVYFNCSDYSNQNDSTCEKWRIIGVFKNMIKEDGSKADLVKIIRDDSLGELAWDINSVNDWSTATLQTALNGDYYNGTSSCKPNDEISGEDACPSLDFTSTGLKNDLTRNAIESVVWNLGGSSTNNDVTASMLYERERGTTVYSGRPTTWTGKIGLMYPSDYGYATAGGTITNRATCMATKLYGWNDFEVSDCRKNDYLYEYGYDQWTLTLDSSDEYDSLIVNINGYVNNYYVGNHNAVRPVAFLKSNISITDVGIGTAKSPYQLSVK